MRLLNQLKSDIRFQFRHGFYYAYIFVTLIYSAVIFFLPESAGQIAALYLILSDTTVLGFFFIGGVIMLEKKMDVLVNVACTPLSIIEYIISKAGSFLVLTIASSIVIQAAVLTLPKNPFLFLYAVILSGSIYTMIGIILGTLSKSVNQYMALSISVIIIIFPTVTYLLNLTPQDIFILFPLTSALLVLNSAVFSEPMSLAALSGLIIWNLIFFAAAYCVIYRHIYGSLFSGKFFRRRTA